MGVVLHQERPTKKRDFFFDTFRVMRPKIGPCRGMKKVEKWRLSRKIGSIVVIFFLKRHNFRRGSHCFKPHGAIVPRVHHRVIRGGQNTPRGQTPPLHERGRCSGTLFGGTVYALVSSKYDRAVNFEEPTTYTGRWKRIRGRGALQKFFSTRWGLRKIFRDRLVVRKSHFLAILGRFSP